MAIYGIGAFWGNDDMTVEFLNDNKICIGWSIDQAPSLYRVLKDIKIGDIVYIKSFLFSQPPPQIRILAIGIVIDDSPFSYNEESKQSHFKECLNIRWLWRGNEIIELNDPYNVRANTLFEEFNPVIQKSILDLILNNLPNII